MKRKAITAMVCVSEGRPPHLTHTKHKTMAQSIALINEITDQELDLSTLTTISGGGKEAKTKIGKWVEKTFGNGDGEHELSDYADEGVKFLKFLAGSAGVHQEPGTEDPGPGVLH